MKIKFNKEYIFLIISFLFLFITFYNFFWKKYIHFDTYSEKLIMGRMIESERSGIFSYGGFPGVVYKDSLLPDQYNIFFTKKDLEYYTDYSPYVSQNGGQGWLFSFLNNISPFSSKCNFVIFKIINSILSALVFTIFLGWCYRNYSFFNSCIVLLFIILSPWLVTFAANLWWALWIFYLPFLTMLLLLEKNSSENKILIFLYFSVFLKIFFNGFEFITTVLLAIYVPIIYYFYLNKLSFKKFIYFSFKVGITSLLGVFTGACLLVYELKRLKGSFDAGINHLLYSYKVRSSDIVINDWSAKFSSNEYIQILIKYLAGNIFPWMGKIYFVYIFVLIIIIGLFIYLKKNTNRKYKALILATFFSFLPSLSWIIIFKQHALIHTHLDFIVWYIPLLLFSFLLFSIFINKIYKLLINRKD